MDIVFGPFSGHIFTAVSHIRLEEGEGGDPCRQWQPVLLSVCVCVCILCIERLRIGQFLILMCQLSCPNLIS